MQMKPRILYVCNDSFYFAQHRAHVARRMLGEGWQVDLAVGGDLTHVPAGIAAHALTMDRLRFTPTGDWRLSRQIRRVIVELRPDIVHFITMKPIVFGALGLLFPKLPPVARPKRIVATFPGLGRAFENNSMKGAIQRAIVVQTLRRLFRSLPAVATFENASDMETLRRSGILLSEQGHVLKGAGLDLEQFAAPPRKDEGKFRVLWASRLIHGKGLAEYIEAARLARAQGATKVEFLVAGYRDPGHEDSISAGETEKLRTEPAIRFLGHVTDMAALLRSVDTLVLPSRYNEGLPRSLIEAAASALPTIASDNAGCRAVVLDDVTGLILPEVSAEAIWNAVSALATNPEKAREMGAAASHHIRTNGFSENAVQEAFLSSYGLR